MKKILIIEDDALLGHYFLTSFTNAGFETRHVISATDGYAAISQDRPDLIVLDLLLPKIDGFEFLQHIKEDADTRNIPVVVASNLGDERSVVRAMDLGASYYFIKANVLPEDIIKKAEELLK